MSRRAWLAFAGCSVLWGIPYLFIRIAVRGGVPPAVVAFGRVTLAAVVLLSLGARAGVLGQLRGRWRAVIGYAVAEIAIPFPLIAAGEQRVSSSLAAIVIASVPLIGAALALRFDPSERPTRVRGLGMVVGFAGVVVLMGVDVAGSARELVGAGAVLIGAVGYAIGPMLLKLRLDGIDARAVMGASLAVAAAVLAIPAALSLPLHSPRAGAVLSVVVLGLACTAAAFVVAAVLIREAGTSRAMVFTYINPVIAVALGVALLGERPGVGAVAGLALILAGSWVSTGGRMPPVGGPAGWVRGRSRRARTARVNGR